MQRTGHQNLLHLELLEVKPSPILMKYTALCNYSNIIKDNFSQNS